MFHSSNNILIYLRATVENHGAEWPQWTIPRNWFNTISITPRALPRQPSNAIVPCRSSRTRSNFGGAYRLGDERETGMAVRELDWEFYRPRIRPRPKRTTREWNYICHCDSILLKTDTNMKTTRLWYHTVYGNTFQYDTVCDDINIRFVEERIERAIQRWPKL